MYAAENSATPIKARSSLSGDQVSGTNSGSITLAMNSMVISGTPALIDRIKAVGEEIDPVEHEGPAGAYFRVVRPRQTVGAAGTVPHRVDQEELDQRRRDPDDQQDANDGQRDVQRTGQQVLPE